MICHYLPTEKRLEILLGMAMLSFGENMMQMQLSYIFGVNASLLKGDELVFKRKKKWEWPPTCGKEEVEILF